MEFFIDSSLFLNLFLEEKRAKEAAKILANVEKGIDIGYVTPNILEEVTYKLIISKAIEILGKTSIWTIRDKLRKDEEFRESVYKPIELFSGYIQKLLKVGLRIIPIIEDDYFRSINIIKKYGLLPSDALTVAVMKRKNINVIASFDIDFRYVENIKVIP